MKPDHKQPEEIGRMSQNFETMHRQDSLEQIAQRLILIGLFLIGALSVLAAYAIFGGR